jgi:hypothetical protein
MSNQLSLEQFDLSKAVPSKILFPLKDKPRPATSVVLPRGFPEANVFALLRALFGPPNGLMSKVLRKQGDPDAPFKYEYCLDLPDGTSLSILRSWLNLEIRCLGRTAQTNELVQMFTHNFTIHAKELSDTLGSLEVYRLLINPYSRHHGMMLSFEAELKQVEAREPDYPSSLLCTKRDERSFMKQLQAYIKTMHKQNSLATSLVTESAFVAESLLNIFIALLKKPLLSGNAKLLSKALYESWRDKIERLPLHCDHLVGTPDPDHPAVKAVERVFKRRNRIAHSYPDPDDLCAEKIWFDNCVPILPRCESYVLYQMGVDGLVPSRTEALECPALVEGFVQYMFGLLHTSVREEMQMFCSANPIGFSEKTGRYGVPFGDRVGMAFFPSE